MLLSHCLREGFLSSGRLAGGFALSLMLLAGCGGGGGGGSTTPPPSRTLSGVQVAPATASVAAGSTVQYTAMAVYSDATKADVTTQASWSTSASGIASVDSAGKATTRSAGNATLTATYQGVSGTTSLTVTTATLKSIAVTATKSSLPSGLTLQLLATGTYSDGTQQDVTSAVAFTSSSTSVASIAGAGVLTAAAVGSTDVTASLGAVTSPAFRVSVTAATLASLSVAASGNPISIPKGISLAYKATGTYTDGSTHDLTSSVTWASSNTGVATMNSAGVALGTGVGQSSISATSGGIASPAVTLTVTAATLNSVSISPASPTAPVGVAVPFTAIGHYSDGSTVDLTSSVTWLSSNTAVAQVSNAGGSAGRATGLAPGSTQISATEPVTSLSSGDVTLNIVPITLQSIVITPASPIVQRGQSQSLTATGTYNDGTTQDLTLSVNWSSDNTAVALMSSSSYLGVGVGTTTVRASYPGTSVVGTVVVGVRGFAYFAGSNGVSVCTVQPDFSLTACGSATNGSFPGLVAGVATDGTNIFLSSNNGSSLTTGTIFTCAENADGTLNDGNGGACAPATAANYLVVPKPLQLAYNGVTSGAASLYAGALDGSNNPNSSQPQYCFYQPNISCPNIVFTLPFTPVGIAASTSYLYVSDGVATTGSVYGCALDGSGVYTSCAAIPKSFDAPSGLFFTGGRLYVTAAGGQAVVACTEDGLGGLSACTTSSLAFHPVGITVIGSNALVSDNLHSVYRCSVSGAGALSACSLVLDTSAAVPAGFGSGYTVLQIAVP
jgi:Bacterial Ig-like domain (group 2)